MFSPVPPQAGQVSFGPVFTHSGLPGMIFPRPLQVMQASLRELITSRIRSRLRISAVRRSSGKLSGLVTFSSRSNGAGEYLFVGPAKRDSVGNLASRHAGFFAPLSNRHCFAVARQAAIRSAISRLFLASGPAAIVRRVIALVIVAFNLVRLGRAFSHIGKEVLKVVPAIADGDSTASVAGIGDVTATLTPAQHRSPAFVGNGFGHTVRPASVRCFPFADAATANGHSFHQFPAVGQPRVSAFTSASPDKHSVLVPASKFQNSQFAERLPIEGFRLVELGSGCRLRWVDDWLMIHAGSLLARRDIHNGK